MQALDQYEILDTPQEDDFEDIVKMAARACNVPISLVTFLTSSRQWFKAKVGTHLSETTLDVSICSHAILQSDLFVVPDTTKDPRFADNPLVAGNPHLRFYAGAILETPEGLPLGTMCILDYKPRELTEQEGFILKALARQVMTQLELRRALKQKQRSEEELLQQQAMLKEAQNQLLEHAHLLEKKVQDRTASLREVIAQMEEFSYSVSHDLRAPVRAMQGYAQAVLEDASMSLNEEAKDWLGRIVRNGRRMDQLIQDILTYSRLNRVEIYLQPVSLATLVREIIQQYPEMQPPHAEIVIQGPFPPVVGHESYLAQAISNLLSNAIKFVPAGTMPRIQIRGERRGDALRLWIEDNGIGILPEHQGRLFGMFERIPSTHEYEGTGIGLAIVKRAMERMGGQAGLASDGHTGSRFWIQLPLASV